MEVTHRELQIHVIIFYFNQSGMMYETMNRQANRNASVYTTTIDVRFATMFLGNSRTAEDTRDKQRKVPVNITKLDPPRGCFSSG